MEISKIFSILAFLLFVSFWVLIIVRSVKNRRASVKTVKATVVDKYITNTVSRMQGTFKREQHIVVFLAGKKKLAFPVSEFSYNGYRIKEKGTLKYKGNQLIDFS